MMSMLDDPGAETVSAEREDIYLFNLEKDVADMNAKIKVSFSYITWK